jgi:hypothetical protein
MGSNFWAWNGEARAAHADSRFVDGDRAFMGDPAPRTAGWYGLFDGDSSTLAIVRSMPENAAWEVTSNARSPDDIPRDENARRTGGLSLAGCGGAVPGPGSSTPLRSDADPPRLRLRQPQRAAAAADAAGAARSHGTRKASAARSRTRLRRDRQAECGDRRARERAQVAGPGPAPKTFDFARMDQIVAWAQGAGVARPRAHAAVASAAMVSSLAQHLRLRAQSRCRRPNGC